MLIWQALLPFSDPLIFYTRLKSRISLLLNCSFYNFSIICILKERGAPLARKKAVWWADHCTKSRAFRKPSKEDANVSNFAGISNKPFLMKFAGCSSLTWAVILVCATDFREIIGVTKSTNSGRFIGRASCLRRRGSPVRFELNNKIIY